MLASRGLPGGVPGLVPALLRYGRRALSVLSRPAAPGEHAAAVLRETRQFYVALDERGRVLDWNRAAEVVFGYPRALAVGRPLERLIIPERSRAGHLAGIRDFARTGHGRGIDAPVAVQALRADGSQVPVELTIWAQPRGSGWVFHALGTDLTERQAHEALLRLLAEHRARLLQLEEPEECHRLLCETTRRAVGCDVVLLYVPEDGAAGPVLRLAASSGDTADAPPARLGPDQVGPRTRAALRHGTSAVVTDLGELPECPVLREVGLRSIAVEPVAVGGSTAAVLVSGWRSALGEVPAATRELLALLASEAAGVLDRIALQERLAAAARTDPLTGLANRRALEACLAGEVQRAGRTGSPFAVVLLDLDHFKAFNDRHGHPAGDVLLQRAAQAWSGVVRAPELLARLGGDEFCLVLPGAGQAGATVALERLVAVTPPEVTLSAGTATYGPGDSEEQLLQRADEALYARKRARS